MTASYESVGSVHDRPATLDSLDHVPAESVMGPTGQDFWGDAERHRGSRRRVFVIAEAGVNHNGDPSRAHQLVDLAADCGADAVKFQTFDPGAVVAAQADAAPYQRERGASTQLDLLRTLVLPVEAWGDLSAHAEERGLTFLSTAFDAASLDLVMALGVDALKIPSGELDNRPFIEQLASAGLPVIISTGLGTLDEVATAVEAAAMAPAVALLHCVTAYPSPIDQSNLLAIPAMRDAFKVPVGWSDHTSNSVTAIAAVALGAAILEKHVTTDRGLDGPDHAASADRESFAEYVRSVREAESALGDGVKRPTEAESANRRHVRRSFHAARPVAAGERLTPASVVLLRPADGLSPSADIVGRVAGRALQAGQPITEEDLA